MIIISELLKFDFIENIGNIAKALGKSWKKLKDGDKGKWNTLALADKERYEKEIAEYNEKNGL